MFDTNNDMLYVSATIISGLLMVIAWFIKRELNKESENKQKFAQTLEAMEKAITEIRISITKVEQISEGMVDLSQQLAIIDKDNNTIKHELELMSQMMKPLFDLKDHVSKNRSDIEVLYSRIDNLREAIHRLEKEIIIRNGRNDL